MTIFQEQTALTCRAIVSSDFQSARTEVRLKGVADGGTA
jgi:hypothetical protein